MRERGTIKVEGGSMLECGFNGWNYQLIQQHHPVVGGPMPITISDGSVLVAAWPTDDRHRPLGARLLYVPTTMLEAQ